MLAGLLLVRSAHAVPPPPPMPGEEALIRQFVGALQAKDAAAYADTLADDVLVTESGRPIAHDKRQWMQTVSAEFARPNRTIRSEGVWVGTDTHDRSAAHFPRQAMILERDDQIFGDCCVTERTEMLTLEDDKVARIELSTSLDTKLLPDGRRQEEQ